jgi:hypothetical protein
MRKTNAPRMSMTQAMVMPTMVPVGRPCVLDTDTPLLTCAFSVPEVVGPMADTTGKGTEAVAGGGGGGFDCTGGVGVAEGVVVALALAGGGMGGELVVVVVAVLVAAGVLGKTSVIVIGPLKEKASAFCLASGAASGQPWKGRRFP